MNTFFEKELNGVLKIAGITMEDITFGTEDETTEEIFECPLCYDDVPMEESTKLGCSHRFCNNCWQQYVELTITEGQSRNMKCMGFKCNESVDELVIVKLIKNKKLRAKYERNIVESYIEDNKNVKWCSSTPPCGSWYVNTHRY
jgi:ariadne-1